MPRKVSTKIPTQSQMLAYEKTVSPNKAVKYTAHPNSGILLVDGQDEAAWTTATFFGGTKVAESDGDYHRKGQLLPITIFPPDNKLNPKPVGTILIPVSDKNAEYLTAIETNMVEAYAASEKLSGQFPAPVKKAYDKCTSTDARREAVRKMIADGVIRLPWKENASTGLLEFKVKLQAVKPGAQTPDDVALGEKLSPAVGAFLRENGDYIYGAPTVTDVHGDVVGWDDLFDAERPNRPVKAFGKVTCGWKPLAPKKEKQSTVFFAMYIDGIQIVAVEESSQEAASSDVSSIFGVEKRKDAAEIFADDGGAGDSDDASKRARTE